jgi:DNA polymerase-3 subunit delta'
MDDEERGFPDVKEILPGGKEEPPDEAARKQEETGRDSIKVSQIRYIKYYAYRRPMAGRRRVFIITQAERMVDAAFNAFLKVLEEPPSLTHFMLLTAYPERIPATIASRCAALRFGFITREDIEKRLLADGLGPERARVLAVVARGSLKAALEADWKEVGQARREAWEILRSLLRREKGAEFLEGVGSLRRAAKTTEALTSLWEAMAAFLRDLLLLREGGDAGLLMNPDYEAALKAEASSLSSAEIQAVLDRVGLSLAGLEKSLNLGLLVSAFYSDIIDRQP